MKTLINITTSDEDLDRFDNRPDFLNFIRGFDGVELYRMGDDARNLIPPEKVIGLHMGSFPYWVDFLRGDRGRLLNEFGSMEVMDAYYGGGKDAFFERFRRDIAAANALKTEYLVLHASDAGVEETLTGRYFHDNKTVADAFCFLVNELFGEGNADSPFLLIENLWQPGFTFTDPEITAYILDGIKYKNKGIMLDTGHLMHTDTSIISENDGIDYIHSMLDAHGELCRYICGIHLHQSITGEYVKRVAQNPPKLPEDYFKRCGLMFEYVFETDRHLPFTTKRVREIIERIDPEYLTFEFITRNRGELKRYIEMQRKALKKQPVS